MPPSYNMDPTPADYPQTHTEIITRTRYVTDKVRPRPHVSPETAERN